MSNSPKIKWMPDVKGDTLPEYITNWVMQALQRPDCKISQGFVVVGDTQWLNRITIEFPVEGQTNV